MAGFNEVDESDVGEPLATQKMPLTSEELEKLDWLTIEKQKAMTVKNCFKREWTDEQMI